MISAIILTKNEENNILKCINSLNWCEEIIVIDDFSTDATVEKIKKINSNKIRVYSKRLTDNFAMQRNFGLEKARFKWVLFIDADEIITDSLQFEILSNINNSLENISGFYLIRRDLLWGKLLNFGESRSSKFLRLAKKNSGKWYGKVHEKWNTDGKIITLNNPLIHVPHPDIAGFLEKINFYSDLRAAELYSNGIKTNVIAIIVYPLLKFIQNYCFKLGIIDGMQGLISAIIMSLYSFLVRGKLWKYWDEKK